VPQHEIEVILMRELAGHLALAVFVVDPSGDLIFYNEPAEALLGTRFDETGPMPMSSWSRVFEPADENGDPVSPEQLPLVVAVTEQRPAHGTISIRGLDGRSRRLEVTALPLLGQAGRRVGAAALFWEASGS
jgi:PAS domain-containing protein